MKGKVLKYLRENEHRFLSGEKISEDLECSRTAVWKQIRALREEGYDIEAVQNKGYRLKKSISSLSEHDIYSRLQNNDLFKRVEYFESLPTTQSKAQQLANEGCSEGTVVVADEQTEGKGRLGRKWESRKGEGVWMSLVLKPAVELRHAPQLTLLSAVAVTRAVKNVTGLDISIKWPNDLLIDGKKICGILTEMQSDPDRVLSVIVGIGLNVNQKDFPEELKDKATSLARESGTTFNRAEIISAVLGEFSVLYRLYLDHGFTAVKPIWEAHAETIGKEITARTVKNTVKGKALGINDDGVLLLQDDRGTVHPIYSADIDFS